jgi:fibronectin-binding autotransporter adhesin
MVRGGLVEISKGSSGHRAATRRGDFRRLAFAIAGAAAMGARPALTRATTTYNFANFTAGTYDWSTGTNWSIAAGGTANANNFPGGDATVVDDIANISFNAAGPTGAVIVTLSSPPPAATLGSLTLSLMSGTSSDTLTLNLNANLSVTGDVAATGGGSSNKNGKVNLNVGAGDTLLVGDILSTAGNDGPGAAGITINGALTAANTQLKDDGDNFTVSSSAGIVNLGNFTLLRSAISSSTTAAGLHLNGGTVSATGFTIGSGNSSGVAVVAGANLTISGSFIVGDPQSGSANTSRPNTMYQTSGNVTSTNSGLALGAATLVTNASSSIASAGTYNLSGGSLTIPMLQMTGSGTTSPSTNKATFALSGGATLNIGSGGIVLGTGAATFTSTGGKIAATSTWTNAYTGTISMSTGTLTLQAADASGNPFDMAFAGGFTGGGTLAKTGAGNLTLSGSSNYTGGTNVNGGTLYVNNPSNSGTGNGSVTVVSGTLGGHGTINGGLSGNVDIGANAHLAPGVNNVGTLTISNLILESGSTADFDFNSAANSMVTVTNSLAINGGGIDLYQEGTTLPFTANGTYNLFNFSGAASVPGNYNALQILNGVGGVQYALGATTTAITLTISGGTGGAAGWAVDAGGSWANAANWASGVMPVAGSVASFGTAITGPRTVTLDGNRSVAGVVFNNANAYTLASGTAGSTLTLDNGAGNATISDIAGTHFITVPVILHSATSVTITNLADTLTLAGGVSGVGNLALSGFGTLLLTGSSTYGGGTAITSGTLEIGTGGSLGAGNITNAGSIVFNSSSNVSVSANVSGTGSITQSGPGALMLSGANSYTGSTVINSGTLQVGSATALGSAFVNFAGAGTVDLNGNPLNLGSIAGSGTFDNTLAASNASLAFNGSATFNGLVENTVGSLAVIKNGSGNLTLGGVNGYSGGTTINAGAIKVTGNGELGSGPININAATGLVLSNGVTLANDIVDGVASTEFEDVTDANGIVTLAGNITTLTSDQYRIGVSGSNATLILSGTSTAQAVSVLTEGNILYAGNASLTVTTATTTTSALLLGRTSGGTLNLTIQDNASISSNFGISLGGNNNTADAATTVVTLNNNATLNAGALPLNLSNSSKSGATTTVNLNGTSRLLVPGFSDSMSKSATLNLNGGSIIATAGDPVGSTFFPAFTGASVKVQAGGVTINDGGFAITIAQALVNGTGGTVDGGVIKTGTGSLTFASANTYTGNTVVSAGKLFVNNATGSGTGTGNVILNGGNLGGSGIITGSVTAGSAPHTINPGTLASTGVLTVGSLATNGNTTLAFDLASPSGSNDLLAVSGNLALSGGTVAIASQAISSAASLGYYKIISYGSLTGSVGALVLPPVAGNIAYTLDTTQNPGFIDLHRGFIGDTNDDGTVSVFDLNTVLNNLGSAGSSWSQGNFDGTGVIDLTDLDDVLNNFNTSLTSGGVGGSIAAPEPASLSLLALGVAGLMARRRRT